MVNIKKTGLFLIASLFIHIANGQPVFKSWDNVIQAIKNFDGYYLQMEKAPLNKLMVACNSESDSGFDKTMNTFQSGGEPWIILLDENGNKLWDRDFYGALFNHGLAILDSNTILMIADILAALKRGDVTAPVTPGTSTTGGSWVVAFDTLGTILWNKRFGGGIDSIQNLGQGTYPRDIKVVNGEIYILGFATAVPTIKGGDLTTINCTNYPPNWAGHTTHNPSHHTDMLFYKVNPLDTLTNVGQWLYGGDSVEYGTAILPIVEGGFLLGGITTSQAGCNQTVSAYAVPYYDYYVVRTDTTGAILWQQRYGGSKNDLLNGLIDAGNKEYIIYGRSLSPMSYDVSSNSYNDTSLWIVKIDSVGNKIWDKRFGSCVGFKIWGYDGSLQNSFDGFKTIDGIKTSDGGFLFVTNVKDSFPCGDVSEVGKGQEDYWLLKLDSAGNKQWDKRFGGPGQEIAQRVVEMNPGHFIIGGYSRGITTAERAIGGDKTEITIGNDDVWLVGVVDSAVATGVHKKSAVRSWDLGLYPNPVRQDLTLTLSKVNGKVKMNLYVYDITGKQQMHQQITASATQINIASLTAGIYILEVRDEKGFSLRKKFVKE